MDKHTQWRRSLAALSADYAKACEGVTDLCALIKLSEWHDNMLAMIRDFIFEPAYGPTRAIHRSDGGATFEVTG